MTLQPVHDADEILLAFTRALRSAGLPITTDRELTFLDAVASIGLGAPLGTFWAGRATLCASPQDLERYDQVYAAWFGGEFAHLGRRSPTPPVRAQAGFDPGGGGPEDDEPDPVRAAASRTEVLRHRDIATLSAADRERLARLVASLRVRSPTRRAPRHTASKRGEVDARATLRAQLRRFGEPTEIRHRRRAERPRRVVLLLDVSGSMSAYADALLRFAHRVLRVGGPVEVFTVGTRLTHVTRALSQRDPERAVIAAGEVVPDWSGGTRLGDGLAAFLDRWGRRGTARGAVVVICSDGWERDSPELLGEQMRRLHALAHRVVWVNPHRAKDGYAPVQVGMAAALPHIDDFVAGHSLATYQDLAEVIARA